MANEQWNGLFSSRPNAVAYTSAVSGRLPKKMQRKSYLHRMGFSVSGQRITSREIGPLRLFLGSVLL